MSEFAPVNISEEDGIDMQEESSSESSQPSHFRRGKVLVAGLVLVAVGVAFSQVRAPGVVQADVDHMTGFYSALQSLDIDPENLDFKRLNTSGMPKDHFEVLQAYERRLKLGGPPVPVELASATCAISATQGAYYLERAALAITAATESCKGGKSRHVEAACAADISGVYASFAFVAEYIAEAVAQCTLGKDIQAACASGISGVVANTGRVAVTAATMAGTCSQGAAYDKPVADSVWQMTRRLQGANVVEPTYDERGTEIATCALDLPQAATYLALFGTAIDRATRTCDRIDRILTPREEDQITCAANIFDVLESLFMAASFISSGVSHCAPVTNQQALCASGAVGVEGAVFGLVKNALIIQNTCVDILGRYGPKPR